MPDIPKADIQVVVNGVVVAAARVYVGVFGDLFVVIPADQVSLPVSELHEVFPG